MAIRLISNFQFQISNDLTPRPYNLRPRSGLSLIEVLIVMAVFSVISVIAVQIFNSSIRATNKAKVTSEVEESGKTLMDIISRRVRQANFAQSMSSYYLWLKNNDGQSSLIFCQDTQNPTTNGKILIDEDWDPNDPDNIQGQPLSNTDPVLGVDIWRCSFNFDTATRNFGTIWLQLKPGVQSPSYKDFTTVDLFQTVSLRN